MEPYQQLEIEWARWNGLDPAGMVACSSGTAALHLALEAFEMPSGSEVLVPDFTMIACARAVALAGLRPVFVDCGDDLLIAKGKLGEMLEARSRETWPGPFGVGDEPAEPYAAFMSVHVYGRHFDMHEIFNTKRHSAFVVIEDLAEAHGVQPHSRTDAACWSFYKNKIVCGEEGGAVWFRDPARAEIARELRSLGFTAAHDFMHRPRGHNYRLANALATLILGSLRNSAHAFAARWEAWEAWNAACPADWRMPRPSVPWVYDLRIRGMERSQQDEIVRRVNELGVAARHGFKPMRWQPEFCRGWESTLGKWKSDVASREVVYLPLTGRFDPKRIGEVFETMWDALRK